jgi:hypothetical protein
MKVRVNGARAVLAAAGIVLSLGAPFASAATDRIPARWKNCRGTHTEWAGWVHATGRAASR